jgi:hypothetical protein
MLLLVVLLAGHPDHEDDGPFTASACGPGLRGELHKCMDQDSWPDPWACWDVGLRHARQTWWACCSAPGSHSSNLAERTATLHKLYDRPRSQITPTRQLWCGCLAWAPLLS